VALVDMTRLAVTYELLPWTRSRRSCDWLMRKARWCTSTTRARPGGSASFDHEDAELGVDSAPRPRQVRYARARFGLWAVRPTGGAHRAKGFGVRSRGAADAYSPSADAEKYSPKRSRS